MDDDQRSNALSLALVQMSDRAADLATDLELAWREQHTRWCWFDGNPAAEHSACECPMPATLMPWFEHVTACPKCGYRHRPLRPCPSMM